MAQTGNTAIDQLNEWLSRELVNPAMSQTRSWHQMWDIAKTYLYGDQSQFAPAKAQDEACQANYIWPAARQEVNIIAQRNPLIVVTPVEPSDAEGAELWQHHLQWLWHNHFDMQRFLMQCALDGKAHGFWVARHDWCPRHEWDHRNRRWIQRPRISLIQPYLFGVDPEAENIEDAKHIVITRRATVRQLCMEYPQHERAIKAAAERGSGDVAIQEGTSGVPGLATEWLDVDDGTERDIGKDLLRQNELLQMMGLSTDHVDQTRTASEAEGVRDGDYVWLQEIYWRDPATHPAEERAKVPQEELLADGMIEDLDGIFVHAGTDEPIRQANWPTRVVREFDEPTYPYGRYVLRIGNVILNAKPSEQVWPYRRWPVTVGVNYVLPHLWTGLDAVQQTSHMQDWINTSMGRMARWLKVLAFPQKKVESGALADDNGQNTSELLSREIIKIANGKSAAVSNMEASPLSPAIIQVFELMAREMRDLTGMQEVGLGKQMKGDPTATEIAALTQNSQHQTAVMSKLMDVFTRRMLSAVLELCQANYEPDDMIRLAGGENADKVARIYNQMLEADFDLSLDIGTALPQDKERKAQQYKELLQMGFAVHKQLLSAMDIEDVDGILQETQLWQEFQAWKQQAEQTDPSQAQGTTA